MKYKFGEVVKRIRIEQKLSQEKLAELTGLHRTYISEVERGERNVSLVNIYRIAHGLNKNVSELFLYLE
ncbi:MAG: helix-turn-helix domain-containing protein [Clostridiales bacterium]|nr:helix-turn-helix domain-containing protein [Clostridiales bacterium]MCF8023299.1 helix-turn-helix domain-containing protein [Clostridiales bacterium]